MKYLLGIFLAMGGVILVVAPFAYCAIVSRPIEGVIDEFITYVSMGAGIASLYFAYRVGIKQEQSQIPSDK